MTGLAYEWDEAERRSNTGVKAWRIAKSEHADSVEDMLSGEGAAKYGGGGLHNRCVQHPAVWDYHPETHSGLLCSLTT